MVVSTDKEFPPFHVVKYQCLAAISANLIVFCHGLTVGWCAPSIWLLSTDDSPLSSGPVSLSEASWIGSTAYVGSIIGNCLFSIISMFFGGKITLSLLAVPNLASWIIVLYADHPIPLMIARCLAGVSTGGAFLCVPIFISEIAHKNIRGILGSLLQITSSLGVLFGIIVASYVPYELTPIIFSIPGLIYACIIIILPETPERLLMKKKDAEKSFRFYNFGNDQKGEMDTERKWEFEQLRSTITNRLDNTDGSDDVTFKTFFSGSTLKGLLVGLFLCALAMFSGIYPINTYAISIFKETGTNVDATISAITITLVEFIGACVATVIVDRWGRKFLLSISCFGSTVSLFAFATFVYLHQQNYAMASFQWVPVTSMSLFFFASTAGILTLPFIIIAESLPQKTRRIGCTICTFWFSALALGNVKFFPILASSFGLHTVVSACGGVCLLGFFFAIFVLEETKGKALKD